MNENTNLPSLIELIHLLESKDYRATLTHEGQKLKAKLSENNTIYAETMRKVILDTVKNSLPPLK